MLGKGEISMASYIELPSYPLKFYGYQEYYIFMLIKQRVKLITKISKYDDLIGVKILVKNQYSLF